MEVCTVANNGKKVVRIMKIQFPAGGAKPGPALAGAGIQMPKFCTAFNDQTKDRHGETVPVILTVYEEDIIDNFIPRSHCFYNHSPHNKCGLCVASRG